MQHVSQYGGYFVHRINPELAEVAGIQLWYYGLTYSLGFLGVYLWFRKAQRRLGWSDREILDLSILVALGALLGGRAFEIVFYEWSYYSLHPALVFSYWRGGMATHGILLGGTLGMWLFSRLREKRFLAIGDEMAIPGAFIMGVGRIGNFIDGNIVGSLTDVWWAVKFPNAVGFRHPVTLYDSLKNFLMIPLLLVARRTSPPRQGMLLAHVVFWYGFGRLFVDLFREYPTTFLGVGTGQYFNFLMAALGLGLMGWSGLARGGMKAAQLEVTERRKSCNVEPGSGRLRPWRPLPAVRSATLWPRRLLFILLLLFPLIIPTDWTQGNVKQPAATEEDRLPTAASPQLRLPPQPRSSKTLNCGSARERASELVEPSDRCLFALGMVSYAQSQGGGLP
jgi:phosphatidylglycerol:prolipoprotein diacylglycerol transferase